MYIEIKNRFTGEIILCGEYESIKDCLQKNSGANLTGADLHGANLYGANNIKLPIITISGSMHSVYYHNGKIRIGCENHTVAKWKKEYKTIGKDHHYTAKQITEYKRYIDACAKLGGE
jgi:hypothetical protein